MRKDFLAASPRGAGEEDRGKSGGKRRQAAVDRGEGWDGEGAEGGGSENADPFPRWPLWTAPLPTAHPDNHGVPRPRPLQHANQHAREHRHMVA